MEVVALQQPQQPHANANGAAVAAHLNTLTVILLRAMCAEKGIALELILLVLCHAVMNMKLYPVMFDIVIQYRSHTSVP